MMQGILNPNIQIMLQKRFSTITYSINPINTRYVPYHQLFIKQCKLFGRIYARQGGVSVTAVSADVALSFALAPNYFKTAPEEIHYKT